jgi:hypothetical protein
MAPGVTAPSPQSVEAWLPFAIAPNSRNQVHYFLTMGCVEGGTGAWTLAGRV